MPAPLPEHVLALVLPRHFGSRHRRPGTRSIVENARASASAIARRCSGAVRRRSSCSPTRRPVRRTLRIDHGGRGRSRPRRCWHDAFDGHRVPAMTVRVRVGDVGGGIARISQQLARAGGSRRLSPVAPACRLAELRLQVWFRACTRCTSRSVRASDHSANAERTRCDQIVRPPSSSIREISRHAAARAVLHRRQHVDLEEPAACFVRLRLTGRLEVGSCVDRALYARRQRGEVE